jgi:large subunit ribosomal protein L4
MKLDIKSLDNKKVGSVDLDKTVFALPGRPDLLIRMVNWQLAKRRGGHHKTKGISDVRGTTAKPFNQKGGGRARQGSLRSAQMRGGAIAFGPVVRDHSHKLPRKVRQLALKTALSTKQAEGKILVLDSIKLDKPKTKDLIGRLSKLGLDSALIIDGPEVDANFGRAAANIPGIDVLPQQGINVYDILRRDTLVLTKQAIEHLEARLK